MDVLKIAAAEIGYKEDPGNKTKYGKWFGLDGVAWCAMFVSWCYDHAGHPLGDLGFKKGFAGCQTGYELFKNKGWITELPVPGDIVLFDWNGDGRYDHTGLFVDYIDPITISTIEGNTSYGNNSNGGEVMARSRKTKTCVFVHPQI